MKKTVMIFGVSSFIGSNLLEYLKNDFRIIGTYFKTPVNVPGLTCIECDVLKRDFVSSLVSRFRPDVIIYAVGISSLTECQNNPKQADALNSAGAVNCCTAADRYNAKFVYFSSGFVLAGERINYREAETPLPDSVYGTTLSSTEFYIQRSSLNYLILRCSPLYGRSYNPQYPSWFDSLQKKLSRGEKVVIDDFVHTGFLDIEICSKLLKTILDLGVTNRLIHVSTKDLMTRYSFAKTYAKIFKKDENLIEREKGHFPIDKGVQDEQASFYYQLDTTNLEEYVNVKIPTIEESLFYTYRRMNRVSETSF
jgi:dTDP-4-dehydrorhamnose reductase